MRTALDLLAIAGITCMTFVVVIGTPLAIAAMIRQVLL